MTEKLARLEAHAWKPRTAAGKRLAELRRKFIESGGELLDQEGIADELRQRRGGLE